MTGAGDLGWVFDVSVDGHRTSLFLIFFTNTFAFTSDFDHDHKRSLALICRESQSLFLRGGRRPRTVSYVFFIFFYVFIIVIISLYLPGVYFLNT